MAAQECLNLFEFCNFKDLINRSVLQRGPILIRESKRCKHQSGGYLLLFSCGGDIHSITWSSSDDNFCFVVNCTLDLKFLSIHQDYLLDFIPLLGERNSLINW